MGVGVHRDRDPGVAEDLHHHTGRVAHGQEERGARVAQIVKPEGGLVALLALRADGRDDSDARPDQQRPERPVQVAWIDRSSHLGTEHEVFAAQVPPARRRSAA